MKPITSLAGLFVSLGLTLSALSPASAGEQMSHQHDHRMMTAVQPSVDMEVTPAEVRTGEPATMVFSIRDQENRPVRDLAIVHDRILHVVVVGSDLAVFAHIHPEDLGPITEEMKERAVYPVRYTFPKAGAYLVAVDYAVGDNLFSDQFSVEVSGEPRMGPVVKDLSRDKLFDGYRVTLSTGPGAVRAGEPVTLTYRIRKDGKDVTDLEPYLSAAMHIAVVSSDLSHFLHTHGDKPGAEQMDHMMMGGHMHMSPGPYGPEIEAPVVFPEKGLYGIFSQIMHHGKVILLEFMLEVQ